jgi:hypothetical protein
LYSAKSIGAVSISLFDLLVNVEMTVVVGLASHRVLERVIVVSLNVLHLVALVSLLVRLLIFITHIKIIRPSDLKVITILASFD